MKKTRFLIPLLVCCFISAQAEELQQTKEDPSNSILTEQIEQTITQDDQNQKQSKFQPVPRDTVPVENVRYLIDTPIPKTAHYLPLMQRLLNIELGSLPNPLGISFIGSYTSEQYTITKFKGTLAPNLGNNIINGILGSLDQKTINGIIDGSINTLYPLIKRDKDKIIQAIKSDNHLSQANKQFLEQAIKTLTTPIVGPIAIAGIKAFLKSQSKNPDALNQLGNLIDQITGAGKQKEWKLSEGKVRTKTSAVGIKADVWILPFMNLFATATYLNMEQQTRIGSATLPLDRPIGSISSITFPIGTLENKLSGYAVMGGTNIAIGYKGFFTSFMISGGFVQLDDTQNNIKGFVEKPFMYLAPRIGYSYHGVFTIHTGVQRVELLGATEGKDLSKLTGGLVSNYSVEITKFPLTFVAGFQFMFMRDLGLSVEYVGSPDTNGLNAELAFRF